MKFFEEMVIGKQRRNKTVQKEIIRHVGLDTETLDGRLHLLTYFDVSEGLQMKDKMDYLYINVDEPDKNIYHILKFLTQRRFNKSLNWFYNLNYDVRAILRWMDEEHIQDLYDNNKTVIGNYTIVFLPNKFITITYLKKKYKFFDIAQFFRGGLDKNAGFYLEEKKKSNIDVIKLGESAQYWNDNLTEIIKYCLHDSYLTGKLGAMFYANMWQVLSFNPPNPYSAGSISQEYFINYSEFIPDITGIPEVVLAIHQNNYRGGRIEIMKRGYFEDVYSFDIKSAYPAEMRDLMDYSNGNWVKSTDFDERYHGIYKVKFTWFNDHLGFIAFTIDNKTIYPNTDECISWMNEKEICFLNDNSEYCVYEILEGYKFIPFTELYPYRKLIDKFYELKETTDDVNERMLYKLFINSIYGKTAQAIYDKKTKMYKTGRLYNPLYSCRITANTRLKLLQYAMPIAKDIIGFSTDSILTTNSGIKVGKNIGDFELEYVAGEGVVLMSGIRYMDKKQKVRGFANSIIKVDEEGEKIKEELVLKDILKENPDKRVIEIVIEKPVTIFQGLTFNKYNKDDINVFKAETRFLDINGDVRRMWESDFKNAGEIYEGRNIGSMPFHIIGESNR